MISIRISTIILTTLKIVIKNVEITHVDVNGGKDYDDNVVSEEVEKYQLEEETGTKLEVPLEE